jgi:hypothetical protein
MDDASDEAVARENARPFAESDLMSLACKRKDRTNGARRALRLSTLRANPRRQLANARHGRANTPRTA